MDLNLKWWLVRWYFSLLNGQVFTFLHSNSSWLHKLIYIFHETPMGHQNLPFLISYILWDSKSSMHTCRAVATPNYSNIYKWILAFFKFLQCFRISVSPATVQTQQNIIVPINYEKTKFMGYIWQILDYNIMIFLMVFANLIYSSKIYNCKTQIGNYKL